jgi:hypothetical protein
MGENRPICSRVSHNAQLRLGRQGGANGQVIQGVRHGFHQAAPDGGLLRPRLPAMTNDVPSPEDVRPTAAPATHDLGGAPGAASGLARHRLLTFTVLTLVLSWLPVIPYALGLLFPAPLSASGPFLAAIVTVAVVGGRKGLRAYFRRLIRWRVGVGWYVVAFLAPVAGWAIVVYVNVLLGAAPPSPVELAGWSLIVTSALGFLINPLEAPGRNLVGAGMRCPRLV